MGYTCVSVKENPLLNCDLIHLIYNEIKKWSRQNTLRSKNDNPPSHYKYWWGAWVGRRLQVLENGWRQLGENHPANMALVFRNLRLDNTQVDRKKPLGHFTAGRSFYNATPQKREKKEKKKRGKEEKKGKKWLIGGRRNRQIIWVGGGFK